jgi:hypothetical protein
MTKKNQFWSSPYRTRQWLFGQNDDTFCKKELELWEHLAGFGRRGCKDTNAQLSSEVGRRKTQIKLYLHNMEENAIIARIPGFAHLDNGKYVGQYRYRRIVVLPWSTRRAWRVAWLEKQARGIGQKPTTKRSLAGQKPATNQKRSKTTKVKHKENATITRTDQHSNNAEAEKLGTDLSQDSVPNPASPSGLTGNQLLNQQQSRFTTSKDEKLVRQKARSLPMWKQDPDKAIRLAKRILEDKLERK